MSYIIKNLPEETIRHVKQLIKRKILYEVLSMGGGVQSSTLWLMNCAGLITPRAEFAVFSDTMNEIYGTYEYLDYLDEVSIKAGLPPIMRVTEGSIIADTLNAKKGAVDIPFFTDSNKGNARGMLNRQCTKKYKIDTVKREVRKIFGMKQRFQWIGFSMDEMTRRNDTLYPQYIKPRYPLLEMRMSRDDCKAWLKENGHPEPPKSSCAVCPFRSDPEWAFMKKYNKEQFEQAAQFDKDSRELVPPPKNDGSQTTIPGIQGPKQKFHVFLHESKQPLDEVEFREGDDIDHHGCGSVCAL